MNAVCLVSHFDDIESLLNKTSPDVWCISETGINHNKIDYQIKLVSHADYKLAYDKSPLSAGGVAIYIRSCYK